MHTVTSSIHRWAIGVSVAIFVAAVPVQWTGRWSAAQASAFGQPEVQQAPAQATSPAPVPKAKRAFETRDWYKLKTVGSPAMSPDGKYVALQVTSVLEAKNARVNEIWVVSTAPNGGDPVRFSAPGFDSTNPRFNPDGTLLIFNSTRPGYTSDDAFYVDPAIPGGVRGKPALLAYFQKLLGYNPNWVWSHMEGIPLEDGFLNKWRAMIPVGSKTLEVFGVCLVQLDASGKIRRNEVYFDRSELLSEIAHVRKRT